MKSTYRYIASTSAIITMLIALIIIGNWLFFPPETPVLTGTGIAKFNTGVCLLLSAAALLLLNQKNPRRAAKIVAMVSSLVVLLLGSLTLAEHIFKINPGIDELFLKETNPAAATVFPGRMAPLTAALFILLGLTQLLLLKRKFHLLIRVILATGFVILSLIFLVYITRVDNESQSLSKPTGLYTSFGLLLLYTGIFLSYPVSYLTYSFQKRMGAFFTFSILLLVIVFFSFQRSVNRAADTARWVEHTNKVLFKSQEIMTEALEIETGTRGYIVSGEEIYLEPFNRASAAIYPSFRELKELTRDNPGQKPRMDSLEKLIDSNLALRKQQISLVRGNKRDDLQKIFTDGTNRRLMDRLRSVIASIQAEENKLLNTRKTTNDKTIGATSRIIILFQVITALLLLAAFFVIYRNIRSRNKAEQEIRRLNETLEQKVEEKTNELLKSELHFRNILDNLLEGAQIIGFDWKYIYVNNAFLKHATYQREELLGHTVLEKYPGIEKTEIFKVYHRCFTERIPIHLENEFTFPGGTTGWFELSFQPVPEGIFILSMDITERKKSEEALLQLNAILDKRADELQVSNTELERFAYVASHDLQEPLRMVSSFLHLLERKLEGKLDETNKQYIDFAVDGAERMKKLIQDLLQYSRVGTSRESITAVDCNEVMETVRSVLALSIYETKATLQVNDLPVIKAVHPQMVQLFQNLVGNALKYKGEEPPVIEVGCIAKGNRWEFYVKDNGIGIDPRFFDKIFIIFQRLHNKTEYSGTGIGLSICKKIVEKHGGEIRVASEPGKGSIFYFTLPKK